MGVCISRQIARSEENAKREAARRGSTAYKCENCDWWHVHRPVQQAPVEFRPGKKVRRR